MNKTLIFSFIILETIFCAGRESFACRLVFPGAAAKSNEANFAYFDNVALIQFSNDFEILQGSDSKFKSDHFARAHVIKLYKGDIPREFLIVNGSEATCGYDLRGIGKFLAFFDARTFNINLQSQPILPVLRTTLTDFSNSKLIAVDYEGSADEIIKNLARH